MKNLFFLVVLSAVVCTVWSEAEWEDCDYTEMKRCLISILDLADDRELGFMNREKLDRVCQVVDEAQKCLDSYIERCVSEEMRHYVRRMYNNSTHIINKLCDPGPYHEEFLHHAPCIWQVSNDNNHCVHQYQQKIGMVLAKLNDQKWRPAKETSAEDDGHVRTICCSTHDYVDCIQGDVMEKCGEQATKYIKDAFNEMYLVIMQDRCKSYPRGSDQCQDSSASKNFQRALLLPISLAMLSLYAVRST